MKKLLLGNEAIARGAYEAGCKVATAYPGTPSTEITENIAKYDEMYCEWSPNEKVALEVAMGASLAGSRVLCSMKHVGLNVAADPLFTIAYTGVNGGMVIAVADDPGIHSSQNEQDTRLYGLCAHVPIIEPADSGECKDYVKEAFAISEQFDTPVILRLTTRIAHSQSIVEISDKEDYIAKPYVKDINKYVMMPAMAKVRHNLLVQREIELEKFSNETGLNKIIWGDKKIGIITSGVAYQYAREALGEGASYLKLGMVHPIPIDMIKEFASQVDKLYVIEELEPFFENQLKAAGIDVVGKEIMPRTGELSASIIANVFEKSVNTEINRDDEFGTLPNRPPVMCAGCPHRGTFYILKKIGATVMGDIGCYTLGALPPMQAMDACICMGASIGMAHGFEKAIKQNGEDPNTTKVVAVLGDSTFIHSGITGLIDAVYNKGVSTILILDNSITGMTGHQDNPTTGFTIKGEPTKQVDLVKLSYAIGVERVKIVDPFEVDILEKTLCEEMSVAETSVIIIQRPCALLKYVKFEGPVQINQDKCKMCKKCLHIACPAIVNEGDKITVDVTLCVGCRLCDKMCAFDAFEKAGDQS